MTRVPPIEAEYLRLADLARYQSRASGEVRDKEEIYRNLLKEFWLGRLPTIIGEACASVDRLSRLKAINHIRRHPGFVFLELGSPRPKEIVEHPDGSITLDSRIYIDLPSDPASWTDAICSRA